MCFTEGRTEPRSLQLVDVGCKDKSILAADLLGSYYTSERLTSSHIKTGVWSTGPRDRPHPWGSGGGEGGLRQPLVVCVCVSVCVL